MICLQCQKTYPIHFCPMPLTDAPEAFQVVKHKFEVFGYCKNCQRESAPGEEAARKPAK
ncbi:Zinc-specific metallo-regulatory protein [compost metagenome]